MTDEQAAWVMDHLVGLANGAMVIMGMLVVNIVIGIIILIKVA
jgi:hypothetical protein